MSAKNPLRGIALAIPAAVLLWVAILIPAFRLIRGHHLGSDARIMAMQAEREMHV